MTQHVGRHNEKILEEIQEKVKVIQTSLNRGEISREKAKEGLLKIIQVYRQELETGKINLNSVGRK